MVTGLLLARDSAIDLARTLAPLVSGAVEGVIGRVFAHAPRPAPDLERLCAEAGCEARYGVALADALAEARSVGGGWVLAVGAGLVLPPGWVDEAARGMGGGGGAAFAEAGWTAPLRARFGRIDTRRFAILAPASARLEAEAGAVRLHGRSRLLAGRMTR